MDENLRPEEEKKLDQALAGARPKVPSDRMWKAIQARLDHPLPPEKTPGFWDRFFHAWTTPRLATAFAGLAAAGLLVLVVKPPRQEPRPVPQVEEGGFTKREAPAARPAEKPALAPAPAAKPESRYAEEPAVPSKPAPQAPEPRPSKLSNRSTESTSSTKKAASREEAVPELQSPGDLSTPVLLGESAGLGGAQRRSLARPQAFALSPAAPARLPEAEGQAREDGSWDWAPFQFAYDNRLWPKAASELQQAREGASSAGEKAFAASLLHLLSQPGRPFANFGLEGTEDLGPEPLMVLSADQWTFSPASGVAQFWGGVTLRQSGLRAETSKLVLDIRNGRAIYGEAARFTRLAGEAARVQDAAGAEVGDNEFTAPDGAVYHWDGGVLKLENDRRHLPF